MSPLNRRAFMQLPTGALLTAASRDLRTSELPSLAQQDGVVRVTSTQYLWEYVQAEDSFRLKDSQNRLIVEGNMQPSVVVAPAGDGTQGAVQGMRLVVTKQRISRNQGRGADPSDHFCYTRNGCCRALTPAASNHANRSICERRPRRA